MPDTTSPPVTSDGSGKHTHKIDPGVEDVRVELADAVDKKIEDNRDEMLALADATHADRRKYDPFFRDLVEIADRRRAERANRWKRLAAWVVMVLLMLAIFARMEERDYNDCQGDNDRKAAIVDYIEFLSEDEGGIDERERRAIDAAAERFAPTDCVEPLLHDIVTLTGNDRQEPAT